MVTVSRVPGLKFANAYLVDCGSEGLMLVDTGTSAGAGRIASFLRSVERKPEEVGFIFLTHSDPDHSGSAAELRRFTGAKIAIHELDAPRVVGEKRLKEVSGWTSNALLRLFFVFMKFQRFRADTTLKEGDAVGPLTVVHVPGHTEGSVCFYLRGEALFSGDTLVTKKGKVVLPSNFVNFDGDAVKRSAKKIAQLEFGALYPGHGEPILRNAHGAVRELADSLRAAPPTNSDTK
jgi:hydroxyacylglutathione hydrolase